MKRRGIWLGAWIWATGCFGQAVFHLEVGPDSATTSAGRLAARKATQLVLQTDSMRDEWPLPYPVYRFCTGDVDGDGSEDALVGVVKATRYYPEEGRRLFIFKNFHGCVRPLWMGSRLGGILHDFRFVSNEEASTGVVRSLEATTDQRFVVAEYRWDHFGLTFVRFLAKNVDAEEGRRIFEQD